MMRPEITRINGGMYDYQVLVGVYLVPGTRSTAVAVESHKVNGLERGE